MSAQRHRESTAEPGTAGFAVLDDKGRISLPKPLRGALGLHAGSTLAYIGLNEMILLIPQDEQLGTLMDRAAATLEAQHALELSRAKGAAGAIATTEAFLRSIAVARG